MGKSFVEMAEGRKGSLRILGSINHDGSRTMEKRYVDGFYQFDNLKQVGDKIIYHCPDGFFEDWQLVDFRSAACSYGMRRCIYVKTKLIDGATLSATHGGIRQPENAEARKERIKTMKEKSPGYASKLIPGYKRIKKQNIG